jgi:4-amino-4-deoxy-L-arabinose transferase-like glycosyltransferase
MTVAVPPEVAHRLRAVVMFFRRRPALSVFLLAVGLRVAFTLVFQTVASTAGLVAGTGGDGYDHLARSLLNGTGYRFRPQFAETISRLPGYPLVLVAMFTLFGDRVWPVQLLQGVLAGVSCALIYRLGKTYFSERVGVVAGFLYAVYPGDFVASTRFVTEPLATFLLVCAVSVALWFMESPHITRALILGGVLGAASLVRDANLLIVIALLIVLPLLPQARAKRRTVFVHLVVSTLMVALLLTPWIIRGYRLSGTLILPTTAGGPNLGLAVCVSRHSDFVGDYRDLIVKAAREEAGIINGYGIYENGQGDLLKRDWWTFMRVDDEVAADRILRKVSLEEIAANPARFVRSGMLNLVGFWFRGPSRRSSVVSVAVHLPLLLLAMTGVVGALCAGHRAVWLLVLIIAYFNCTSVASAAFVRYSLPVMPLVVLLAASGIEVLRSWFLGQGSGSPHEYS